MLTVMSVQQIDSEPTAGGSEPRENSASATLLTVLAEFAGDRPLPHAGIVRVLELVGLRPATIRQAISRAARAGALERPPQVARGVVMLTEESRRTLDEMYPDETVPGPAWDGQWTLVSLRGRTDLDPAHATRNRLLLESFGSLGAGLWLAPHTPRADAAVRMLGSDPTVDLIGGAIRMLHPEDARLVERAWDLGRIRDVYSAFSALADSLDPRTDAEALAAWITVRRQWNSVARADPQLPAEVLPEDWPAEPARRRMQDLRERWLAPAQRAFYEFVT